MVIAEARARCTTEEMLILQLAIPISSTTMKPAWMLFQAHFTGSSIIALYRRWQIYSTFKLLKRVVTHLESEVVFHLGAVAKHF